MQTKWLGDVKYHLLKETNKHISSWTDSIFTLFSSSDNSLSEGCFKSPPHSLHSMLAAVDSQEIATWFSQSINLCCKTHPLDRHCSEFQTVLGTAHYPVMTEKPLSISNLPDLEGYGGKFRSPIKMRPLQLGPHYHLIQTLVILNQPS